MRPVCRVGPRARVWREPMQPFKAAGEVWEEGREGSAVPKSAEVGSAVRPQAYAASSFAMRKRL